MKLLDFSHFDFDCSQKQFLLAVSGGVDSMVLATAFLQANIPFVVAHVNYNLRGVDSKKDAQLVQDWCKKVGVNFFLKEIELEDHKKDKNGSIQLLAREVRYAWFNELVEEYNLDFIVTAHHLEDLLETQLINISRGTEIKGLNSLGFQNGNRIRPLIHKQKSELLSFAKEHSVLWREDKSNQKLDYLRNKIRHNIVPHLQELHPTFWENVAQTSQWLSKDGELVKNHIQEIRSKWEFQNQKRYIIPIAELRRLNPLKSYLYHLFSPFGFDNPNEIQKLMQADNGAQRTSNTHSIEVFRDTFFLEPLMTKNALKHSITLEVKSDTVFIQKDFEVANSLPDFELDLEKIKLPLVVRPPKSTDVIFPVGMLGSKALAKFMRDSKMNPFERQNAKVLSDQNDSVICLLNRRLDRRFITHDNTNKTILVCYK